MLVYRHKLFTRLWHWLNALAVIVLIMSGLMISNAHPRLYWGEYGANLDQAWLDLRLWLPPDGRFPGWLTIPSDYSLTMGRRWHLAFAWVMAVLLLAYMVVSLANRHLQRDLFLSRREVAPGHLWQDIKDHARLRFPTGQDALTYNPLQKITYALVIFVLLPLAILSGLALSPGFDAGTHISLLFGGRQTARSLHFLTMVGLSGFIVVHLLLVVLAGPYNEIRLMITGRFRIRPDARALVEQHADLPA